MNILILTSIYPGNGIEDTFTPVVHYFAREWVRFGHNVRVVHSITYFPSIFYKVPRSLKKVLMEKVGFTIPSNRKTATEHYVLDGVEVYRMPIFKLIPMGQFRQKDLEKQGSKIYSMLLSDKFIPDIITSHWINPQLYLSEYLKRRFSCKTALVIHEGIKPFKLFRNMETLINSIDFWGYRSGQDRIAFENQLRIKPKWFRCYSGIPGTFLKDMPNRDGSKYNRFIFVGQLIPRKHPDKVIEAVEDIYHTDHSTTIIGDGPMKEQLNSLINEKGLNDRVVLPGRVKRSEIISYLDNSDIFVMISKGEAFGLVYIEAMARGCIVIASKNEGMEGIIQHGVNGFLCESGDKQNLKEIITYIKNLSDKQRKRIITNGIETAQKMTDINVAKAYLNSITE